VTGVVERGALVWAGAVECDALVGTAPLLEVGDELPVDELVSGKITGAELTTTALLTIDDPAVEGGADTGIVTEPDDGTFEGAALWPAHAPSATTASNPTTIWLIRFIGPP
jgi:hypothetical protein